MICCPLGVFSIDTAFSFHWASRPRFIAASSLSRSRSQIFRLARTRLLYSNSSHVAVLSIFKLKGRSMYLDNFQIQGPNWMHEVFVTEVVASFEWPTSFAIQSTRMWDQTRRILLVWNLLGAFIQFWKSFVHQAFLGVSYYLHIRWIVHGGKHMILLLSLSLAWESSLKTNYFRSTSVTSAHSASGLNERTESDLLAYFGIPERVTPILAESGGPDSILRTLPHSHYLNRWVLSKGKTTTILWN